MWFTSVCDHDVFFLQHAALAFSSAASTGVESATAWAAVVEATSTWGLSRILTATGVSLQVARYTCEEGKRCSGPFWIQQSTDGL